MISRREQLEALLARRILVLDGAMGTMIQRHNLTEADFRGDRFRDLSCSVRGDHDLLVITRPDLVRSIHDAYLAAGSDIVTTNTFNSNALSQADYGLGSIVFELNLTASRLAKEVCAQWTARTPEKPRFVAGSIGPTGKALSVSSDPANPAARPITFDALKEAYKEQVRGLIDGGCDLLLLETAFDALNAKAAIVAIEEVYEALPSPEAESLRLPLMISATLARGGRTLAGQTIDAFWVSVAHARPFCIGINCGSGARPTAPHLERLAELADCYISSHPNAGLPDAMGHYTERPEDVASALAELAAGGLLNIAGGCCGTTPEHIAALARSVESIRPRNRKGHKGVSRFAGLETLSIGPGSRFQPIGQRASVSGSRRFSRAIRAGDYAAAGRVALEQVRAGAALIDISMDEAMLDAERAMTEFLKFVATEPEIARVPVMIDSSSWPVVLAGLKSVQGKPIVNSISLEFGETSFLERAAVIRRYGAGVVVMAFDEHGQAETTERKVAVCQRAYTLLTEQAGFDPTDIILDLNVLAIATGLEEHNRYGLDFIEAVRRVKTACPGAKLTAGVSNLSFSFRGNEMIREAMHSAFLHHAVEAGLDMGHVNVGQLPAYGDIPSDLLERVEDLIFDRRPDATERIVAYAAGVQLADTNAAPDLQWRGGTVEARIIEAVVRGVADYIAEDADEARRNYGSALRVIDGPLTEAMNVVSRRFGDGTMLLPEVVKSARVMKRAAACLEPFIGRERQEGSACGPREDSESSSAAARASGGGAPRALGEDGLEGTRGTVVLATVKGDVHDIGKNIVALVLRCSGYEVVDLGVMVPADRIVQAAIDCRADAVGLSGLIAPSLDEMIIVAREMARRELRVPLLIGGAATSKQQTAVRIAPEYAHLTVHVPDASRAVDVVSTLLRDDRRLDFEREQRQMQATLRDQYRQRDRQLLSYEEALANRWTTDWPAHALSEPSFIGRRVLADVPVERLVPFVDWTLLFAAWQLRGSFPAVLEHPLHGKAARALYDGARALLDRIIRERLLVARAVYGFWPAGSAGDDIIVYADTTRTRELMRFAMLRQQAVQADRKPNLSLADFVAPLDGGRIDHIGAFAVTAGFGADDLVDRFERQHDDYSALLVKVLANRLAEAFAAFLEGSLLADWSIKIRPAFGYPACPDHSERFKLFELLRAADIDISLTEHAVMVPAASVSGLYFAHPGARYFTVGVIGDDQIDSYAQRKGQSVVETKRWLAQNLQPRENIGPAKGVVSSAYPVATSNNLHSLGRSEGTLADTRADQHS